MSLTISNQGNADLPKLAKGVYHGTCFRIVDLGESIQEYKGEKNKRKRVHISFEITEAVDPSDNAVDMDDGRPFAVSKMPHCVMTYKHGEAKVLPKKN